MKTAIFNFNEKSITFVLDKNNTVMVNATEMAKVFEKQVNEFMSNETTKKFIESCLKNGNSRFLNIKSEDELYVSRQKSGTYMHRVLALKFAAWLDSDFEVWVFSTIDKLLFGKYVEREQSFKRSITLQNEQNELINRTTKSGEDFDRYLEIERELRQEKAIRKSLTIESVSGMKNLFEEE